jgi:hypothetical protein
MMIFIYFWLGVREAGEGENRKLPLLWQPASSHSKSRLSKRQNDFVENWSPKISKVDSKFFCKCSVDS